MNVEKQINKLKERVKELEEAVFEEEVTITVGNSSPGTHFEEFNTWVDDNEPERESAVDMVRRLL